MAEQTMNTPPGEVRVRGTRDGIVFTLPERAPSDRIIDQIRDAVDRGPDFFRDAKVILNYGDRTPDQDEIAEIEGILNERAVQIRSITASRFDDRAALREMGQRPLRIVARSNGNGVSEKPASARPRERRALYVRRTLRSGTSIASDGDLVVMGDINAGAEAAAVGDIIVWGAVRGTVHAGSAGETDAMICALRLQPTQLRIGKLVARPADDEEFAADEPQRAHVDGSTIVVEPWRGMERSGR